MSLANKKADIEFNFYLVYFLLYISLILFGKYVFCCCGFLKSIANYLLVVATIKLSTLFLILSQNILK